MVHRLPNFFVDISLGTVDTAVGSVGSLRRAHLALLVEQVLALVEGRLSKLLLRHRQPLHTRASWTLL